MRIRMVIGLLAAATVAAVAVTACSVSIYDDTLKKAPVKVVAPPGKSASFGPVLLALDPPVAGAYASLIVSGANSFTLVRVDLDSEGNYSVTEAPGSVILAMTMNASVNPVVSAIAYGGAIARSSGNTQRVMVGIPNNNLTYLLAADTLDFEKSADQSTIPSGSSLGGAVIATGNFWADGANKLEWAISESGWVSIYRNESPGTTESQVLVLKTGIQSSVGSMVVGQFEGGAALAVGMPDANGNQGGVWLITQDSLQRGLDAYIAKYEKDHPPPPADNPDGWKKLTRLHIEEGFVAGKIDAPQGAVGFGSSLAARHVLGSGHSDQLIVGAPGAGTVYVYDLADLGHSVRGPAITIRPSHEASFFGKSVGVVQIIEGKPLVAVGDPKGRIAGAGEPGYVELYDVSSGAPRQVDESIVDFDGTATGLGESVTQLVFGQGGSRVEKLVAGATSRVFIYYGAVKGQ